MLKKAGLYALLVGLLPLALLELGLRLVPVSSPPILMPVSAANPVPRYQANVDYHYSWGPDFELVTLKHSNNYGFAHKADYRPEATTPLLMVIGDSFVEAQQVDAGKSAPELLHAAMAGKGRVYSIGVSGAPLSQYLVFADYARRTFRPDAMAFFIIGNDFDESLLKYKSEPRFHYFEERDGRLELRRVDYQLSEAKKLLRHSAFLRYVMYNLSAEQRVHALLHGSAPRSYAELEPGALEQRLRDSERAVDYFFERLPGMSGLQPRSVVFVLDAVRPAIYSAAEWERAQTGYHERMRRYFAARAAAHGYAVIDMQPVFIERYRRDGVRFEFRTDRHWNELGHRVVAGEVGRWVDTSGVLREDYARPAEVRAGNL